LHTTPERIDNGFLPPFESLLDCIMKPDSVSRGPQALAEAFAALHRYFAEYDYAQSVSSPQAWNAFLRSCRDQPEAFTLEEATKCMRWLQRYLAVSAVAFPDTDVVHASMAGLAGVPGVIQKFKNGTGFVLTEHGIYLRELYLSVGRMKESVNCRRFLFRWYEAVVRMNYRYADSVTSLCEFNRRWQIQMGAEADSIEIVPNGVDSTVFHAVERPADMAPTVLTMARIYRLKGIDHLIRAIGIVAKQAPEVRFRILGEVGDRQYSNDCRELADKLGVAGCIEWSQTSDPASAYQAADVLCLPSISEAMPYSVLEAMFSGCPVVATDVGGVAEMLGSTGLVVPPRNPEQMAAALLSLLAGQGAAAYRRELADRALERARSRYEITECSQRFQLIYDRVFKSAVSAQLLAAG
jgi:glycosyltransferase involved in cell wall biosynthesis